ncbi:MAG: AMP-dependent synthetase/ligase [Actinomycetota bacterium]|nr:AMP-dependent synthetase/ligase [Actinomycetota bacterium]
MERASAAATIHLGHGDHLASLVDRRTGPDADAVLFRRHVAGSWRDVTAQAWRREVEGVARGFVAAGVQPGDRVAVMSRTRYEWTVVDFALWTAGAVCVPVYETSSAEQVEWILADSQAVGVVVEHGEHAAVVASVRGGAPSLRDIWVIDHEDLASLTEAGAAAPPDELDNRRASLSPDSLATLIYTSGTTGRPKGVELTHGNLLFDARAAIDALDALFEVPDASTLLFLPLAHVFARAIQVACVDFGITVAHSPDVTRLAHDLQDVRPTFVLAVPRVFEKIYNGAANKAAVEGRSRIFAAAADTAIAFSRARDSGRISPVLRGRHAVLDRLVYRKLRQAMGGNVEWAVSGGAALGARLGHFFRGAGITVLEGYGLTETSAASTVNTPTGQRIGTVGRPLPGTEIGIAADGEVLLRGPHLMRGYWNQPAATAEAIDADGWLHTGDLGALDADGYLTITGRKKELLVTAGGKNVAPAALEDRLRAHPMVSQALVVGDGRPFVAALITLDDAAVAQWCEDTGRPAVATRELLVDPDLLALVQEAVDDANRSVSQAEAVRRFRLLADDFTEEGGELTPTMKVRRHVVESRYAADVESLYA